MIPLCVLAAALNGVPGAPVDVVVGDGESLIHVARRALGDEQAVEELMALNALSSDSPAPGTHLKLPGPERSRALSALGAARTALAQAARETPGRSDAAARLAEAESLFRLAHYVDAAKKADAAWQRLSARAKESTTFAVSVADNGRTHVSATGGRPVRVEAQGSDQLVYAGQKASVDRGQTPQVELEAANEPGPLDAPAAVSPVDAAKMKLRPQAGGLGPVHVSWTPVNGAIGYEIELLGSGKPVVLSTARTEARLPLLAAGKYRWAVRSIGSAGARSLPSAERAFELEAEAIKLDIRETSWK